MSKTATQNFNEQNVGDVTIIEEFQAGNAEAGDEFVARFTPLLKKLTFKIGAQFQYEDTDNLFAVGLHKMLDVLRKANTQKMRAGNLGIFPYLNLAIRRALVEEASGKHTTTAMLSTRKNYADADLTQIVSPDADVAKSIVNKLTIEKALAELSYTERYVLCEVAVEEKTFQEISRRRGRSPQFWSAEFKNACEKARLAMQPPVEVS